MKTATTIAVTSIVVLLFASLGLNAFLAIEREETRELLDEARRYGFVAERDRPCGCGWVRVPRCDKCGRFHGSPPPPAIILPGPTIDYSVPVPRFEGDGVRFPEPMIDFPTPALRFEDPNAHNAAPMRPGASPGEETVLLCAYR